MLEIFEINTKNNFFALLYENLSNLYLRLKCFCIYVHDINKKIVSIISRERIYSMEEIY